MSSKRSAIIATALAAIIAVAIAFMLGMQRGAASAPAAPEKQEEQQEQKQGEATPKQVQVPNFVQLEKGDAQKLLVGMSLTASDPEYVFSDTVAKDHVVSQKPEPMTMVDAGTKVTLTISKGPEAAKEVSVPNVCGMTQAEAEQALTKAKLVPVPTDPIESDTVEPGKVCRQSVAPNTKAKEGDKVRFTVSLGKGTTTVPDVAGKTFADAKDLLTKASLGVDQTTSYDDKVAKDSVISQSIPKGTAVTKGTTVTLNVSLGAKPVDKVKVPDLTSCTLSDAVKALGSAGLAYRYSGDAEGTVVYQDPAAGTEVAPNSLVTFTLQYHATLVTVPNVAGMTGHEAFATLEKAGLRLSLDSANPDRVLAGTNPAAGTEVEANSVVQAVYAEEPKTAIVPDVAGMMGADARDLFTLSGLMLDYDVRRPDRVLAGTDPAAGTEVPLDTIVSAVYDEVEPEADTTLVPDVRGMRGSDAKKAMEEAGLLFEMDVRQPDRVIADTKPVMGTEMAKGEIVEAVYPEGKAKVPDVAGMTGAQAKEAFAKEGLYLELAKDDLKGERVVLGTNPKAGTEIGKDQMVVAIYDEAELQKLEAQASEDAPAETAEGAEEENAEAQG